jgi:hypothetical protein
MPDPEPLITTETTLPAAMKIEWWSTKTTDRKCMTTGGGIEGFYKRAERRDVSIGLLLHQAVLRAYVHRWLGLFIQFRLEDEEADKGFSRGANAKNNPNRRKTCPKPWLNHQNRASALVRMTGHNRQPNVIPRRV